MFVLITLHFGAFPNVAYVPTFLRIKLHKLYFVPFLTVAVNQRHKPAELFIPAAELMI